MFRLYIFLKATLIGLEFGDNVKPKAQFICHPKNSCMHKAWQKMDKFKHTQRKCMHNHGVMWWPGDCFVEPKHKQQRQRSIENMRHKGRQNEWEYIFSIHPLPHILIYCRLQLVLSPPWRNVFIKPECCKKKQQQQKI